MTSIGRKPTNRTDAFICIRSVSLNDGAYMEVPGQSFPLPSEARWWFVVHRVYQLGTYVNPVYTLIWVGFALHHCSCSLALALCIVRCVGTGG
jgi:hypothetical protein